MRAHMRIRTAKSNIELDRLASKGALLSIVQSEEGSTHGHQLIDALGTSSPVCTCLRHSCGNGRNPCPTSP